MLMTKDEMRSLFRKHRTAANVPGEYGKIVDAMDDNLVDQVLSLGDTASAQEWGGQCYVTGYEFWQKIWVAELRKTGSVNKNESVAFRQFTWWNNVIREISDRLEETPNDNH